MIKKIGIPGLLAVLMLFFTACGSDGDEPSTGGSGGDGGIDNTEKLIGTWYQVGYNDESGYHAETTTSTWYIKMIFSRDGDWKQEIREGNVIESVHGTWTFNTKTQIITVKYDNKEEQAKVIELTSRKFTYQSVKNPIFIQYYERM